MTRFTTDKAKGTIKDNRTCLAVLKTDAGYLLSWDDDDKLPLTHDEWTNLRNEIDDLSAPEPQPTDIVAFAVVTPGRGALPEASTWYVKRGNGTMCSPNVQNLEVAIDRAKRHARSNEEPCLVRAIFERDCHPSTAVSVRDHTHVVDNLQDCLIIYTATYTEDE